MVFNFNNHVILNGGIWNITKNFGVSFTNGNCTVQNATILYNPDVPATTSVGEIFNTFNDWGALYVPTTSSPINAVSVNGCTFSCTTNVRPPFIALYGNDNTFSGNINIKDNLFIDSASTMSLAIAIVNSNTSSSLPVFENINITGNRVNYSQGMIISGRATPNTLNNGTYTSYSACYVNNGIIENNTFGYIGLMISDISNTNIKGITIRDNYVDSILTGITATLCTSTYLLTPESISQTTSTSYGLPFSTESGYSYSYTIENNRCCFIKVDTTSGSNNDKEIVSRNIIQHTNTTIYDSLIPPNVVFGIFYPQLYIGINLVNADAHIINIVCSDNTIDSIHGRYDEGISIVGGSIDSGGGSIVSGNIIFNIPTNGYGLLIYSAYDVQTTVTGNTFHKEDGAVIAGFIFCSGNAEIYGNSFSDYNIRYPDGYDFDTIQPVKGAYNYNQAVTMPVPLSGVSTIFHKIPNLSLPYPSQDDLIQSNSLITTWLPSVNDNLTSMNFTQDENGDYFTANWSGAPQDGQIGLVIPIGSIIPTGAGLLSFSINVSTDRAWSCSNGGTSGAPTPNSDIEMVLEIDGIVVDSQIISISGPSNFDLYYQSDSLLGNLRPSIYGPESIVVRAIQSTGTGIVLGAYFGPTPPPGGEFNSSMYIGPASITFVY